MKNISLALGNKVLISLMNLFERVFGFSDLELFKTGHPKVWLLLDLHSCACDVLGVFLKQRARVVTVSCARTKTYHILHFEFPFLVHQATHRLWALNA